MFMWADCKVFFFFQFSVPRPVCYFHSKWCVNGNTAVHCNFDLELVCFVLSAAQLQVSRTRVKPDLYIFNTLTDLLPYKPLSESSKISIGNSFDLGLFFLHLIIWIKKIDLKTKMFQLHHFVSI